MNRKVLYGVGAIVALIILAFAYWAISPLFIHIKVDDELSATPDVPIQEFASASVIGTTAHPASGMVRIVEGEGKRYVRYENYKTINGPDLFVYLAKDIDASEYIDLGPLRATEGNINYEIPAGVNLAEYPYVLTWCRAFSVLFNYADISVS